MTLRNPPAHWLGLLSAQGCGPPPPQPLLPLPKEWQAFCPFPASTEFTEEKRREFAFISWNQTAQLVLLADHDDDQETTSAVKALSEAVGVDLPTAPEAAKTITENDRISARRNARWACNAALADGYRP